MFQQLTIVGNAGGDPIMRFTQDGTPVTAFSVAVNKRFTDAKGQQVERTTWFRVSAWGKLAEICAEYIHRGDRVLVVGEVDTYTYKDNRTGDPRASLEVRAETVRFLGGQDRPSVNGNGASHRPASTSQQGQPVAVAEPQLDEAEIPF
jgi:single-strand DNA-binding protein